MGQFSTNSGHFIGESLHGRSNIPSLNIAVAIHVRSGPSDGLELSVEGTANRGGILPGLRIGLGTNEFQHVIETEDTVGEGGGGGSGALDVLELSNLHRNGLDGVECGEDGCAGGVGGSVEGNGGLAGEGGELVGETGEVVEEDVLEESSDGAVEVSEEEVGGGGCEELVGEGEQVGVGLAAFDGIDDLVNLGEGFVDAAANTDDGDEDADEKDGVDDEGEGHAGASPLGALLLLLRLVRLLKRNGFVVRRGIDGHFLFFLF